MKRRFVGSVTGYINELEEKIRILMQLVRSCERIPDDFSGPYILGSEVVVRIKEIIQELEEVDK